MSEHRSSARGQRRAGGSDRRVEAPGSWTSCAATSGSSARTSAASTASAARARCFSTGGAPARASRSPCRSTAARSTTVEGLAPNGAAASRPGGVPGGARPAVRVLHAGDAASGHRVPARRTRDPTRDEAREAIASNLCRCTGYQHIVDSVLDAALRGSEAAPDAGIAAIERGRDESTMTVALEHRTCAGSASRSRRSRIASSCSGRGSYVDDMVARRHAARGGRCAARTRTRASVGIDAERARELPASSRSSPAHEARSCCDLMPDFGLPPTCTRGACLATRQGALRRRAV